MVRWREDIAASVEAWAGDPALAPLLRDGAVAIVWDGHARPAWASPAAASFVERLALDGEGSLDPGVPAAQRLRALITGLAPRGSQRLEKLRFDRSSLVPFATCACRLVALPSGEDVLLTTFVGAVPRLPPRAPRLVAPEPAEPPSEAAAFLGQDTPAEPATDALPVEAVPDLGLEPSDPEPVPVGNAAPVPVDDPLAALRERGTVRFLWQADPAARFQFVSEALASVVGPASADIVGRTWAELGDRIEDPSGVVAEHLARGETWSGRTVLWRIDATDYSVPVDLAGIPLRDRERTLLGFRGFGLIRTAGLVERPRPVEPVVPAAGTEAPEARQEAPVDEAAAVHVVPPEAAPEAPAAPTDHTLSAAPEPTIDLASEASVDEASIVQAATVSEPAADASEPNPAPSETVSVEEPSIDVPIAEVAAPPASAGEEPSTVEEIEAPGAPDPKVERDVPGAGHGEPANDTTPTFTDLATTTGGAFAQPWAASLGAAAEPAPKPAASTAPPAERPPAGAAPAQAPAQPSAASTAMARLSATERSAFREIARALGARFDDEAEPPPAPASEPPPRPKAPAARPLRELSATQVLARLPMGVLVHRGEEVVHANRALLDLLGYETMDELVADGGLAKLFRGRAGLLARAEVETAAPVPLATRAGETFAAEIRHAAVDWDDEPAGLMLVRRVPESDPGFRLRALETELRGREGRVRELSSILDTATDGVVVLDDVGRVLSLNRSAEALFGFEQNEVVGEAFTALLAPESHVTALDYLEGLRANGVASLLNDGREAIGRVRQGGFIPLFMTMGRVGDGAERKFCAVLRDITAFKKAEGELLAAKRAAEAASAQKSDFLAKVSHEVRTPLNAIIGFAEVMLEERFGPMGNDRYKDYLRDIHASGEHVISLVNDLLDLAKVEAGRMEMSFTSVSLNELVTSCVSIMQPEAARARIVLRTSFSGKLPPVVADERSVRQIVLNLLSNAVKFTDAGGQVIVSTALTDRGEVAFRVRDTGIGMTETEIEAALEPFRQLATARRGGGTGLGLPLTKALVEANRGMLQISSTKSEGTLVEVVFPPTRVLAE